MPDYDKIAAKYGGTASAGQAPDRYELLAQKYGGTVGDAPVGQAPTRTEKFGHGLMDPIAGASQLVEKAADKLGIAGAMADATNWLSDKSGGLLPRYPTNGVDKVVRSRDADYEARRRVAGETGFDGYRALGNLAPSIALGAATGGVGAGAGIVSRVGIGAAQSAASASLAPVTGNEDFWSEKARQAALGAGLGGALTAGFAGLGRLISPNASTNPSVRLLRSEGVQPTIGQTLGGLANKVEERLQSVPLVGDSIRSARSASNGQFQSAAFNRALAPIGEKLPDGVAGREAVDFTEGVLRQRYDRVLNQIGAIPADQQFGAKLASLGQMVNRALLSPDAKAKFSTVLADVQNGFGRNGVITSEGYKTLESALGADIRKLTSSQDMYDGRLAPAVKQLQQELRDLLQRQAGQSADELQAVNSGWANFKRVQRAAGALGAEDGRFTPAQFQSAVKAMDKSKDKGAFARGGALGQDLGDAGKAVLTSTVPNSGTADRLMNVGGLGALLLNPKLLLGPAAGAGLYLPSVQRALVSAASSRPAVAQPVAEALRNAAPMLIPGLSQFSLDGLR